MKNRKKVLTLALTAALFVTALPYRVSAASSCDGVVIASSLNMRSGPGADYEFVANAPRGTTVTVIGISTENADWFKVSYQGREGFMSSEYIINADSSQAAAAIADAAAAAAAARAAAAANPAPVPVSTPAPAPAPEAPAEEPAPAPETPVESENSIDDVIFSPTGASNAVVTGDLVRFRSSPGGDILGNFRSGTRIYVNSVSGSWYEVNCDGTIGYIHSNYAALDSAQQAAPAPAEAAPAQETQPAPVVTPAPTPAPTPTPTPAPVYVAANSAGGQRIVDTAMQFQGVPYVWGGTSPSGFDCSGLVYYTYQLCGYSINRVAQSIYTGTGTAVTRDQLAVGDIICFGNADYVWHVGIYIGNNQFIHAPNTGAVVRVESLSGTYANNFVCGKRVV